MDAFHITWYEKKKEVNNLQAIVILLARSAWRISLTSHSFRDGTSFHLKSTLGLKSATYSNYSTQNLKDLQHLVPRRCCREFKSLFAQGSTVRDLMLVQFSLDTQLYSGTLPVHCQIIDNSHTDLLIPVNYNTVQIYCIPPKLAVIL